MSSTRYQANRPVRLSGVRPTRVLTVMLVFATLLTIVSIAAPAGADEPVLIRGAYGRDDTATGLDDMVVSGFNTVNGDASHDLVADRWAKGLKAVVWLGPYNAGSCSFGKDDAWIREYVGNVKGHPAIVAYQIDDEPSWDRVNGCPNAPSQMRTRSDLVKSIDPNTPTYLTLPAWDGVEDYPYQYFSDSADIIGLVVYPCSHSGGCDIDSIRDAIAQADSDGLERYWAVMQAYQDDWYKLPSYNQLKQQLEVWQESRMEGYFIYEWSGLSTYTTEQLAALDSRFVDVPRGAGFYDAITWLASEAITGGCNPPLNDRFCPEERVTRAQMAAFLVRALGYSGSTAGDPFVDDNGSIFEADIERLAAAGVTKGCNPPLNDRYCPGRYVTRGQMAAFLVRALGYTNSGGSGDSFLDDNESVFEQDIEKLRAAGVTSGCNPPLNNRYCPDGYVTRAQMAAFLYRALG